MFFSSGTGLESVNQLLVCPSPDGILTSAALVRLIGRYSAHSITIHFSGPEDVQRVRPDQWKSCRTVVFVNLGVACQPRATRDCVRQLTGCGHRLVGLCDEHGARAWRKVLGDDVYNNLLIKPQDRHDSTYKSSSAVLRKFCFDNNIPLDEHTHNLLEAGEAADVGCYGFPLARWVNEVVKVSGRDFSRKHHLIEWFARNAWVDDEIRAWRDEYRVLATNQAEILASMQDIGDGIVQAEMGMRSYDMTSLKEAMCQRGQVAVLTNCTQTYLLTNRDSIKLKEILRVLAPTLHPIKASGWKVVVKNEDLSEALAAIRVAVGT